MFNVWFDQLDLLSMIYKFMVEKQHKNKTH